VLRADRYEARCLVGDVSVAQIHSFDHEQAEIG